MKVTGMARNITVVAGKIWGGGTGMRRKVYEGVVESIMLYGGETLSVAPKAVLIEHMHAVQKSAY